jgi:hypothetical protein
MKSTILLKDDDVRRWYENMARGSKLTASVRLRRLKLFCQKTGRTPAELVNIGQKNIIELENILLDHVSWLESQNYAPGYIDNILKAIRSWLAFNYVQPKRKIKITNAGMAVRIQDERIPTKKELALILDVSGPRGRTSISLMAFSGLCPQVLGNYDGTDGLCLSDIEGLVSVFGTHYITSDSAKLKYFSDIFDDIGKAEGVAEVARKAFEYHVSKGHFVVRARQDPKEGVERVDMCGYDYDNGEPVSIEIESVSECESHPEKVRKNFEKWEKLGFARMESWSLSPKILEIYGTLDDILKEKIRCFDPQEISILSL